MNHYRGSLITARLAREFGREVFGVPRNVTQPVSFAPKQLIKQCAQLVTCAEDVIEELPRPYAPHSYRPKNQNPSSGIYWLLLS